MLSSPRCRLSNRVSHEKWVRRATRAVAFATQNATNPTADATKKPYCLVGFWRWRKRWDSNPRTSYPVTAFRVRAVMTTSIHFRIFDVDKPLRSGHNRHAVRIAMTTSIHFLIENIYRVSAWFIIVYKIYFCNKFCTTWLLLLTICGFSMPTMLDGRENRRIIIYHIYY